METKIVAGNLAVQDREDARSVFLDKAGIKGLKIPLMVYSNSGSQRVSATVSMYSSLDKTKKGVHLSKFMDVINGFEGNTLTLDSVKDILRDIKQGSKTRIEIGFTYFIKKESPVSKEKSYMNYTCKIIGEFEKEPVVSLEVSVPMMTLCPDGIVLTGCASHSQRGYVTVTVQGGIWLDDIINIVELSGTEVFQVLKKPDDKFVMEMAYNNPQFVEDLARDVAVNLKKENRIDSFNVAVENMESNHNYNAFAETEFRR